MKKINKTVNEIITNEEMQQKALEYIGSEDEEEEESEDENEDEDKNEDVTPQTKEALEATKKSKNASNRQKFSARSSSGFSREENDHHSNKKKKFKKVQQHIKEDDEDNYSEKYEEDSIKDSISGGRSHQKSINETPKINAKEVKVETLNKRQQQVESPQKKLPDVEKEPSFSEEIVENYEF